MVLFFDLVFPIAPPPEKFSADTLDNMFLIVAQRHKQGGGGGGVKRATQRRALSDI